MAPNVASRVRQENDKLNICGDVGMDEKLSVVCGRKKLAAKDT